MLTTEEMLKIARLYAKWRGVALSSLSRLAGRSPSYFERLSAGLGRIATLRKAGEWLSTNWPDEDLPWPKGIARPKRNARLLCKREARLKEKRSASACRRESRKKESGNA